MQRKLEWMCSSALRLNNSGYTHMESRWWICFVGIVRFRSVHNWLMFIRLGDILRYNPYILNGVKSRERRAGGTNISKSFRNQIRIPRTCRGCCTGCHRITSHILNYHLCDTNELGQVASFCWCLFFFLFTYDNGLGSNVLQIWQKDIGNWC